MNCPKCKQEVKIVTGQFWKNDRDYKVLILDQGEQDVWVLYIENSNRVPWNKQKFLEEYCLEVAK